MEGLILIPVILLTVLVEILLMAAMIRIIKKFDPEHGIQIKPKDKVVMVGICLAVTFLLYTNNSHTDYIAFSFLMCWLLITAYIDQKTKNVYRIFCYLVSAAGILYLLVKIWDYAMEYKLLLLFNLLLYLIFIFLQSQLKMYGAGDGFVYISVCFYLAARNPISFLIETFMLHMILANLIFLIMNWKQFDVKHFKMKSPQAFVPGIAIATIIFLTIC